MARLPNRYKKGEKKVLGGKKKNHVPQSTAFRHNFFFLVLFLLLLPSRQGNTFDNARAEIELYFTLA